MGRSPSFEECLKPGQELKQDLRRRARREADHRRRPGPRGDHPQQLDPRRRGGDRRPAAAGDRAAAARRGPQRAGRQRQRQRRQGRAPVQDRHPVLDGPDRGDRAAEDGLPRPAQPRRDRGRDRHHRAARAASEIDIGADPDRRRQDLRDARRAATRPASSSSSPRGCATRCARSGRPSSPTSSRSVALYRPGAMAYIPAYAKGKSDPAVGPLPRPAPAARSPRRPTAASSTRSS